VVEETPMRKSSNSNHGGTGGSSSSRRRRSSERNGIVNETPIPHDTGSTTTFTFTTSVDESPLKITGRKLSLDD
jgi:hypothetical protein